MMQNKTIRIAIITGAILAVLPSVVLAQEIPMLKNIISAAFTITGGLIVVGTIIVGVMFLTSGGEPEKINKAKKSLIWLIIGIVVYFGVYTIRNIISQIVSS